MLRDLRFPKFWLIAGWVAVMAALTVCLLPPRYVEVPGANDKVEHALGFVLLTLWFCGIYKRRRYWLVGIAFLSFGIFVEVMQAWMNVGRNGDVHDVYADAAGIVFGVLWRSDTACSLASLDRGDRFTKMNSAIDTRPLADRLRPQSLDEVVGQEHLLAENKPLRRMLEGKALHSMILWGPPGTGKTTLARLIAKQCDAEFIALSAVMAGVKDIRVAVDHAQQVREQSGKRTLLFLDEVHRFNKAQQDAFLPWVEDGTLVFIGATTENPSFELNNALLSRARVYVLRALNETQLVSLLERAVQREAQSAEVKVDAGTLQLIAKAADGDGRRALNMLELALGLAQADSSSTLSMVIATEVATGTLRRFDNKGDAFYDQISALHKSVRGSDPDAALYWLCRMLDGGCDPRYIARRVLRMASEDIGNADPRGVTLSLEACEVFERLGSPEGELAIAQAVIFLACAAKSNAVYIAFNAAMQDAKLNGSLDVPMHLRNAPTRLMKELGHGKGYRYAHDELDAVAKGENYFPDAMQRKHYYHPVSRGLEIKIAEALAKLRS